MALLSPLVVASHNEGKVREFDVLLAPFNITVHSAGALGLPEPEETGQTFEENAELKARASALGANMAALADDSGLVVPAINYAPGIFSARWAGPKKDFGQAMSRIARELHAMGLEPSGTSAYFVCVLALSDAQGNVQCVRGEVHGTLTFPPRGEHGFGYDPIFIPHNYKQTFGEMDPDEKNRISHRSRAFAALLALLQKEHAA
jgi:XTP/dITP diphosphohydrolase